MMLYQRIRDMILIKWVSVAIILVGLFGGVVGFIYWYGPTFSQYPVWQWPFVPDCPLFALLFVVSLTLIMFRRSAWLQQHASLVAAYHAWVAFGLIKYGIWTVTVWIFYWINTGGDFTTESVVMAAAHTGMILEGLFLFSFMRLNWPTVAVCALWFGLSDWMDYGPFLTYPHFPTQIIPFAPIQWHTIAVTGLLTLIYAGLAAQEKRA